MSMERDYIDREVAFDIITDLAGMATTKAAYAAIWKSAKELNKIPSADVVSVREYQELASENRELKILLKLAIEDIDNRSFCSMCANHNDESKCRKCKAITLDMFKWKHGDEAEKLLKSETLAEFRPVVHANWTVLTKRKAIFLDNANEQYKALGFPHRNILQMRCSNCGVFTQVDDSIAYEYCPHCGAKMDGD